MTPIGDMRQPTCSLCGRVGISCNYPASRRAYRRRQATAPQTTRSSSKENSMITERHSSDQRDQLSPRSSTTGPCQSNRGQANNSNQAPSMGHASSSRSDTVDGEGPPPSPFSFTLHPQFLEITRTSPDSPDFGLSLSTFALGSGSPLAESDFLYSPSFDNRSSSVVIESMDSWLPAGEGCSRQVAIPDDNHTSTSESSVPRANHTLQMQVLSGTGTVESTLQPPTDQASLSSIHVPAAVADHLQVGPTDLIRSTSISINYAQR